MRNLINRLDAICHPFPGTHALGLISSVLFITSLVIWPAVGETGDQSDQTMLISAPAKTFKTNQQRAPQSESFVIRAERVQAGDSLSRLFSRQNLKPQLLHALTQAEQGNRRISRLNVGQTLEFRYSDETLVELAVIQSPFQQTVATHAEGGWSIEQRQRDPEIYIEYAHATIDSSLFIAGARAGLPDNLIMELADIYGHVIDFVYEIRKGDQFTVIFEKRYLDGEFIEYGNILAAEFVNSGESFLAVRYTNGQGDTDYYDKKGVSLRKAFLRAPLNFRRISSNFNLARKHPVLGRMRAHKGTDYAASTGTPIYAAGDGKIIYRGTKGGYGRTVIMKHGNSIETRYAHLSRYGKYRRGQKVKQGQVIGYVGMSGLATGPHLHYEFIVSGVHRNPRTILDKLPKAKTLPQTEITRFERLAEPLIASLNAQRNNAELAFQTITTPK
ncbi:MAG: peptidoglycan DD-metalloendopeptidase family protein [Pseudomonadota bacterium]|nr:peptidoglycan DD-metalloendopeptidase family protein [Pseudomonadota bacterium]